MKAELKYEVYMPKGRYEKRRKTLKITIDGEPDDVLDMRTIINRSLELGKWKEL